MGAPGDGRAEHGLDPPSRPLSDRDALHTSVTPEAAIPTYRCEKSSFCVEDLPLDREDVPVLAVRAVLAARGLAFTLAGAGWEQVYDAHGRPAISSTTFTGMATRRDIPGTPLRGDGGRSPWRLPLRPFQVHGEAGGDVG